MDCQKNKELIERYPFLLPRNVFTDRLDPDYDYSYIRGIGEIPTGWEKLFLQMCEDLKRQLVKDDFLNDFRFTQIKEKYNRLECYHNGCSKSVQRILDKYEHLAMHICTVCGKPATVETCGYVASYCNDCYRKYGYEKTVPIENKYGYRIIRYSNGKKEYKKISFLREWNKYRKTFCSE